MQPKMTAGVDTWSRRVSGRLDVGVRFEVAPDDERRSPQAKPTKAASKGLPYARRVPGPPANLNLTSLHPFKLLGM